MTGAPVGPYYEGMTHRALLVLVLALVGVACTEPPASWNDAAPELPAPGVMVPAVDPITGTPAPAAMAPIKVWLAPSIDPEQVQAVRAAVDAWGVVTRRIRAWVYVAEKADADLAISEIGPYARLCDGQEETAALGCVRAVGGLWRNKSGEPMNLYLISGNYERATKLVTMHEIGHLLGLHHDAGGIMAGPASEAMLDASWECPDPVAVAALVDRLELAPGSLVACEAPIF